MRFFLLALIFLTGSLLSATDWHIISTDISEDLLGLHFTNDKNGYVASSRGSIFHLQLTDSGWVFDENSLKKTLKGIYFHEDGKSGIAFGDKGLILRTNDFGANWVPDSLPATYNFADIIFYDNLTGIMVGTDYKTGGGTPGVVYKTTDGGETWQPLKIDGKRFYSIKKTENGPLTITGFETVYTSSDGGDNWQTAEIPSHKYGLATAINGKKGIMIGKGGFLALSDDSGKSWESMQILNEIVSFFNLLMLDSRRAYIIGSMGEILYTEDSGYNWIPEPSGATNDLQDIQKVGNKIFVCGKRGTLLYTELEE
jgi:photosystem II stability/assembly factor-like uncharacterized protein